jgi:predicted MFS family arabinose efflux permease
VSSSGLVRRREGARGLLGALTSPGVLPLVSSAALGRLPLGMMPLGIILLSRQQGRAYGVAGLLVGAYTLGIATSAPLIECRIDRLRPTRVLTERFAWSSTTVIGGSAPGTAIGGAAIQLTGYRASLALAVLFALLATLMGWAQRGELSSTRPEPAAT